MENLLKKFDKEVRANPVYPSVIEVVKNENFVRLTGPHHFSFVTYWHLLQGQVQDIVHREIAALKQHGGKLMWRVYAHDLPGNLETFLENEGLKELDSVTLMLRPLQGSPVAEKTSNENLDIRKIIDEAGIADFLSVTEAAFGQPSPQRLEYHTRLLGYPNFNYFVGYAGNVPVATARFEIPENSSFGFFYGGCVIPEFRGKGFYQALINERLNAAQAMGLEYIAIDAMETSKPILEKNGFFPLVNGRTWYLNLSV